MPVIDENIDLLAFLRSHEAKGVEQHIERFSDNFDEVYDYLINGSKQVGDTMPWAKTHEFFRFRPSELTIWAGVNGNGKSLVMSQCALWFTGKSVIASMEMPTKTTKARILRQACGGPNPSAKYVKHTMALLDDKIFLFNRVGKVSSDEIRGLIIYASQELKASHVMIDSLVKCGMGTDDYNAQKDFVSELSEYAKEFKVHIHLVVHMRKGQSESVMPDKFDVKGAGEITDLADNVLIISRNTKKEMIMNDPTNPARQDYEDKPDGYIRVAKNRHGEWDGLFSFWWHPDSMQWVATYHGKAIPFPSPGEQWSVARDVDDRLGNLHS